MGVASRVDLLLILRGLAAVSVVIWHLEGYKAHYPSVVNLPGRTAVWLFFGISGYVIAYGFLSGKYRMRAVDLRHFFLNRFLRIYPLFLLLSLLAIATAVVQTGRSPIGPADVPAQLMAVQFDHSYVLSGVFWTLGVELHFYLLAPLLVLPLLPRGITAILAGLVAYGAAVLFVRYAVGTLGWSPDGRNVVSNLPHFLVGMLGCRVAKDYVVPVPFWVPLAAGAGLLGWTNWLYHQHPAAFWSVLGIVAVDAAVFCFVLAHAALLSREVRPNAVLSTLAFGGVLSYGIYAWHAYVPSVWPAVLDHLVLLLALSIAAAYLSYRFVERPALSLKRYAAPAAPPAGVI